MHECFLDGLRALKIKISLIPDLTTEFKMSLKWSFTELVSLILFHFSTP
jgi:hypothetical protein